MTENGKKDNMQDLSGELSTETHSRNLMLGLDQLRRANKLLDVTLIVEGVAIKAHRVVLAACSDYFSAMFSEPMKEATQSEIELNGISARGTQILLEYAYTSKIELNQGNVQDILSAATYIQMNDIVMACSAYLESQIDLENCYDIVAFADLYSLEKLKNKVYHFICAHLEEFSNTKNIDNLTCEQLECILSCDYPVHCPEVKVLHIAAEYCVRNKVSLDSAQRIFSNIRYDQISLIEKSVWPRLSYIKKEVYLPYYKVMVMTGLQQRKTQKTGEYLCEKKGVLKNSRGMARALVKIGGFHDSGLHNELSFALPDEKKWHKLTSIPHIDQCNYGVAVLGNDLFIVGGSYDVCLKEYIHGFGFRYNAAKNKWSTMAPIQVERCRFSLNAIGDFLYAVGGVNEQPDEFGRAVSKCERYNVAKDTWEFFPPLYENRSQHAGVVRGDHLYISGGIDRGIVLSSFCHFDIHRDVWRQLNPMPTPRSDHALLVIDQKIYACGGWYEDPQTETRILIADIDVYDVYTGEWCFETCNPVPTFHAGITAIHEKIYFVGGLLSDATTNYSSSVQTYDIYTKKWSTETEWEGSMPTWECTCASFFVPRCREGI